jgi:hypothetical protein
MITVNLACEMLKQQAGISDVETCDNEFLQAYFANPVNPKKPFALIVHPIPEKLVLRVHVLAIAKVRPDASVMRLLSFLNHDLLLGRAGVDHRDGEIVVQINHPCRDGAADDPSLEIFARLVEGAMRAAREVSILVLRAGMRDSGVPNETAERLVDQLLGESEGTQDAEEPTL